jgi:hypothetical protein
LGTDRDYGSIAVMGAGQGVIARRNPFDLRQRTLRFAPAAGATEYTYSVGALGFDDGAASAGQPLRGLGDDDYREVALPFAFPFYGMERRRMFVHSDGNVTFEYPDAATNTRSLGRLLAGPPRIAALFADLDPSAAADSVRVASLPDRVVVTWWNVPEYSDLGFGQKQNVQMVLYPDGAIEINYATVTLAETSVGISAPGLAEAPSIVTFSDNTPGDGTTGAVAEGFSSTERVDLRLAAQRFYRMHGDAYDYLVFFNAVGVAAGPGALASETTVRSRTQGIGDYPVADGEQYGSGRRLQAVLNMGPLSQYPEDPFAPVGLRGLITGDNTMTLLAHETGHLFLALASIRDPQSPGARPMLGAGLAHWSFNFNSEASVLEGNRIQDNGATQSPRFRTVATVEGYSAMDQYLMGLRPAWDVPETFVVYPASQPASALPSVGVGIAGQRVDVGMEDLIAAEGARIPDETVAQRRFRLGFVFIVEEGRQGQVSSGEIGKLEKFRGEFESYYAQATGGRGSADCTLKGEVKVSAWPATGAVAGREFQVEVTASPAQQFRVEASGEVELPESVVIPAGGTAVLRGKGLARGVADFRLVPESEKLEEVHARVPVKGSLEDLRLRLYYNGWATVLIVEDENGVPYSEAPLKVVEGEHFLAPMFGPKTDAQGLGWYQWRPILAPFARVVVEIEGVKKSRIEVPMPAL